MARRFLTLILFAGMAWAQAQKPQPPAEPPEPPEEDETITKDTKEYSFNPLQAANEVKVGNFYFKKGSYKAALKRFEEATKWDPNSAEAFLRVGDTREKLKDPKGMKEAYAKFLELAPDDKQAAAIKKKISK